MTNTRDFDGKVAIVTGASGGIGYATSNLLLSEGARVLLVDQSEKGLASVAAELSNRDDFASRFETMAADVSSGAETQAVVDKAIKAFGKLDIFVANAGVEGKVMPLVDYPEEMFDRVLAVNAKGVFLGIQRAAKAMKSGGSIVVTSSIAGLIGSKGLSAYVASKHAVLGLVKCAALELAPMGIRVNAVCPGPIENRMMRSIEDQAAPGQGPMVKKGFESMVALGRYGTNDEIAQMVAFLASSRASYSTGGVFVADGGFIAQ